MTVRGLRRALTADALGLMLVFIALLAFTLGVSASLRDGEANQSLLPAALIAAVIGFSLARSRWNGIQASVGMAALGVLGVWVLGARLVQPLLEFGRAVLSLVPQIIPAIRGQTVMDAAAAAESWAVIVQACAALAARLQTWLAGLGGNASVNDALVSNMVWTLMLWLFAAGMGWFTARRDAVASLLPSILLLASVTAASGRQPEMLWLLVCILLLLMGTWNFKNHTAHWEKQGVDYAESIRYDVGAAVVMLAVLVGTLAFVTPSISWREIQERLRSEENNAAEMLGIEEQPIPAGAAAPQPGLPRVHLLEGSSAHSQQVVMTIRTGELPPIPDLSFVPTPARYYWRSTTYDSYMGAGWATGPAFHETYAGNTPLLSALPGGYRLVHLDVEMTEPGGVLFWSGMLFRVDVPITANWRVRPVSDLAASPSTFFAADMYAAASSASAYKADVYVPALSVGELRAASTDYPDEISRRYLALPSTVPARVRELALEITTGFANPYDKAKAIEGYLRAQYEYDLKVPAPPEGADVADYFLFDLQKGYCDYYATAMVVLARASGLPARFVSGYAPGSYDAQNAQYIVREADAHSWAEVYFPRIGWIEFEPTAALPEIERLSADAAPLPAQTADEAPFQFLSISRLQAHWLLPFIGAFFLFFICFTYTWIERWWYLHRLDPATAIERMYRRLYRLGRPLAGTSTPAETAYEFMSKAVRRLDEWKAYSHVAGACTNAQRDMTTLTSLYQASQYSRRHAQKDHARTALKTWQRLRWRLVFLRSAAIALREGLNAGKTAEPASRRSAI